jgi:carbon monoxide dehydrogenase subunit G
MELTGEYTINAKRQDVWEALNDPDVLKVCIPGCEELEKLTDTQFTARVTMKVGAIKARLKGSVELSDIDPPNGYTISGQGQGGVAGFAKGGARVDLKDADGAGTVLRYKANAELGGKLAAVGSRVIQGIAKKMADDFFGKFARHLSGEEEKPLTKTAAAPAPKKSVRSPTPASGGSELPGTVRDLIWLSVGIAVGITMTWAYYN